MSDNYSIDPKLDNQVFKVVFNQFLDISKKETICYIFVGLIYLNTQKIQEIQQLLNDLSKKYKTK